MCTSYRNDSKDGWDNARKGNEDGSLEDSRRIH